MSYETAKPYIASYVLIEQSGKIAFVLRSNTTWMNGYYGLPSGKVESDESYSECAIREAKEEVGIEVSNEQLEFVHVVQRHHDNDENGEWVDVYFRAKNYKGEPYNAEPDIHSELAWLDPDNLPENVIPAVKDAIEHIRAGEKYSEFGFN